ncbi:MAG TPA: nitrate/nitrite transporter NrtS, partial [Verrucomicrobiae bacterium]|nr:nitrate/nitrite transporter NrtS [Verrucomicrobiae bacterium]
QRCLRCTLMHRPLIRRSLLIALIVGTLLTAINHLSAFTSGELSRSLAWKIPLNYAVPYSVATISAVVNARSHVHVPGE